MNKAILVGNLVRDPELKYTQSGKAVCKFTLAIPDRFNKENTNFIDCVAWNKTAELAGQYLKKGSKTGVVGSIAIRSYETKDGKKAKATEINVEELEFLTPKSKPADDDGWSDIGKEGTGGDIPF
jgi:single-strand DNA-binding protein